MWFDLIQTRREITSAAGKARWAKVGGEDRSAYGRRIVGERWARFRAARLIDPVEAVSKIEWLEGFVKGRGGSEEQIRMLVELKAWAGVFIERSGEP